MAIRRMMSLKVVDTDAFLEMPQTSQLLYYHLAMRADDDGFVSNPKKIMRMVGSQDDDYKVLVTKKFIIPFESGICVIKHWLIHNLIRCDRYTETQYVREKSMLIIDPQSKKYSLNKGENADGIPAVVPSAYQMAPQDRIGQDSLVQEEKIYSSQKYLESVPKEDITYFMSKLATTEREIVDKAEDLLHYCLSKGRKYKNYRSFLFKALKADFKARAVLADIKSLGSKMRI